MCVLYLVVQGVCMQSVWCVQCPVVQIMCVCVCVCTHACAVSGGTLFVCKVYGDTMCVCVVQYPVEHMCVVCKVWWKILTK